MVQHLHSCSYSTAVTGLLFCSDHKIELKRFLISICTIPALCNDFVLNSNLFVSQLSCLQNSDNILVSFGGSFQDLRIFERFLRAKPAIYIDIYPLNKCLVYNLNYYYFFMPVLTLKGSLNVSCWSVSTSRI